MIDSQLPADGRLEMTAIIAVGLDAIWDGIADGDPIVHGIKIDVQGMELDALRGMRRLLSRHRPKIVLEIHRDVPRDDVLALLESAATWSIPSRSTTPWARSPTRRATRVSSSRRTRFSEMRF